MENIDNTALAIAEYESARPKMTTSEEIFTLKNLLERSSLSRTERRRFQRRLKKLSGVDVDVDNRLPFSQDHTNTLKVFDDMVKLLTDDREDGYEL